jgi:hypothetical protein
LFAIVDIPYASYDIFSTAYKELSIQRKRYRQDPMRMLKDNKALSSVKIPNTRSVVFSSACCPGSICGYSYGVHRPIVPQ